MTSRLPVPPPLRLRLRSYIDCKDDHSCLAHLFQFPRGKLSLPMPVALTPPILECVPSVLPLPGGLPITPVAPTPAQPPHAPSAPPMQTASGTGSGLAKTTDSDIFDQLARLSQLRVQNPAPAATPKPAPAPSPSAPAPLPVGYNQGLGLGSSPSLLGHHLQAQQTGLLPPPTQVGPCGPFAPIPANQALLAPLVRTTTGFNRFVPTRPVTLPSFLGPQPTGFQPSPLLPLARSLSYHILSLPMQSVCSLDRIIKYCDLFALMLLGPSLAVIRMSISS